MFTPENVLIWLFFVIITVTISIILQRLRPGPIMTREEHLEQKVRDLTKQVQSLQDTITLLSNRISALEKENSRLRRMFTQVTKKGVPQNEDVSDVAIALEKLSSGEVSQLAYNYFRDVYNDFSADQSLQARRLSILEYAGNHDQIESLRASILEINPAAFG